jgi:hypothetical protein
MSKYEDFLELKRNVESCCAWADLPNGKKYADSDMKISPVHCSLTIKRMGQKYQGGDSYHNCPSLLANEILKVMSEDESIIFKAIERLKEKEKNSLKECKEFATDILNKIKVIEKEV